MYRGNYPVDNPSDLTTGKYPYTLPSWIIWRKRYQSE